MSGRIIKPSDLTHVPGAPSPDVRARMLNDALSSMSEDYLPPTAPKDATMLKAKDVRARVIERIRPLLTNPSLIICNESMSNLNRQIAEAYANEFTSFSHEDLVWVVTVLHTEMLMYKIKEELGV
jgi:ABC-type branched-subunit amino acid transport system ATPase component